MEGHMKRILILGSGGCAHVLAGMLSSHRDVEVRVMTPSSGEAERWNMQMSEVGFDVVFRNWEARKEKHFVSKPYRVSSQPELAINCQMFIFTGAPSEHHRFFKSILPHVEPGCLIVGMPGGCGFPFQAKGVLREKLKTCLLLNLNECPWQCRINTFGFGVTVLSTKESMAISHMGFSETDAAKNAVTLLNSLLYSRPLLFLKGHVIGDSLINQDAVLKPAVMYGQWSNWLGDPLDAEPLFYEGMNDVGCQMAIGISDEAVLISNSVKRLKSEVDLCRVLRSNILYGADVVDGNTATDKTDLKSHIVNDWRKAGVKHDMVQLDSGKFVPDFQHSCLAEDVPYGLVVMRSLGQITGVQTPFMDEVIQWAETKLSKEYIIHDKLLGRDVIETSCPQKYSLKTLGDILQA